MLTFGKGRGSPSPLFGAFFLGWAAGKGRWVGKLMEVDM